MPIQYDIKKRLYKELTKEKDFIAFLKNAKMTKSFIKSYIPDDADSNDFRSIKSWCDFEDLKDGIKLGVFLLNHGGLDGDGRLAIVYEKENHTLLRRLIYWNVNDENVRKSDIPEIYGSVFNKKNKASIEQIEPKFKLGVSIEIKDDTSLEESQIDQYGLESGDEFYKLSFIQSSPEGALDVKPATYALMIWWKVRMGNKDTIDISSDSNSSMLQFDSIYKGGNFKGRGLGKKDKVEIDHIIEVNELNMLVSLYSYIPKAIPADIAMELAVSLMNINPKLQYGSVEVYTTDPDDGESQHFLRYKAVTCLKGVKVGKVNVVENMIALAQTNHGWILDTICETSEYKKWLLR